MWHGLHLSPLAIRAFTPASTGYEEVE
jgi:hypothetical protein